jgi:hypothetical protein
MLAGKETNMAGKKPTLRDMSWDELSEEINAGFRILERETKGVGPFSKEACRKLAELKRMVSEARHRVEAMASRGGKARAKKLSAKQRLAIARGAARARWAGRKEEK